MKQKTKQQIRESSLLRRRAMTDRETEEKSRRICENLLAHPMLADSKRIYVYAAAGGEPDLYALVQLLWKMKKTVAFPKTTGPGEMNFYAVTDDSQLAPGRFGIREPDPARLPKAQKSPLLPQKGDVLAAPGLAFCVADHGISRIGSGGGYYDRYLAHYPDLYAVGVCYEWQTKQKWEPSDTDVPMQDLVTEREPNRQSVRIGWWGFTKDKPE